MFPRDQFTAVNDPSANTSPQFAFEQSPVNHLSSPAVPNAPHPVTSNQPFAMNHPPQNTGPMPQGHLTPTFVTAQLPPQEAPWWPQTGQMTLGEHALFDNPQAMDTGMSLFGFFGDGANNGCNFRPVMPFHPAPPRPQQIHQPSPVAAPVPAPAASLPSGGCNAGPPESRCGCRRFYSSNSTDKPDGHQFCMCSHHACFHDHDSTPSSTHPPTPVTTHLETPVSYVPMGPPPPPQPQPKTVPVSHPTKTPLQDISDRFIHPASSFGNENARPRSIHSVHSVHSGRSQPPSPARSEPAELRVTGHPPPRQEVPATIQQQHPTSIVNLQHHDSQKTNTAPDDVSIPDTQSCSGSVMNADASREDSMSTVIAPATGRARALLMSTPRPGSQRSVSTTSSRFMLPFGGKCLQLSRPTKRREPLQDRTDDMPEIKKERRSDVPPSRCDSRATTCSASELSTPQPPPAQMTVSGMYNMVNSHQARIDRLENASIVTNAHEECLDRHENVDTRVCELENRMDDVEKQLADGSFKRSEPGSADGSFDKQEFLQQFHSLQEQIAELQQTSPSVAHPWNIEVVLLPFPLRKLWMRNPEFPLDGSITASDNDDWTCNWTNRGAPTTPFLEDRSVDSREQEWLLPRVYRADSVVYERLQSRGFVRTVTVTGGDARSVQIAINHSFKDLLQQLAANRPPRPEVKASKFMGLQQDWIPLRRIPHDTRLRFLSRNEMVTPALWDVKFLHSVIMKSTKHRLFITHPEAYLQDHLALENTWSWQRIRELKRVHVDDPDSQEVREGDAMEKCWEWHNILDGASSDSASILSRRSTPAASVHGLTRSASRRSSSPMMSRSATPLRIAKASRPVHVRTTSMPMTAGAVTSPADNRRRIQSQITKAHSPGAGFIVRRKSGRSSHAQPTPRWSSGSPSPAPGAQHGLVRNISNGSSKASRSANGHYATPHSNSHAMFPGKLQAAPHVRPYMSESDDISSPNHYDRSATDDALDDEGDDTFMTEDDVSLAAEENDSFVQISFRGPPHRMPSPGSSSSPAPWHENRQDEPWPGIEEAMGSDSENIDPASLERAERASETGSLPSEYPSTHPGGRDVNDFDIHEDEDMIS